MYEALRPETDWLIQIGSLGAFPDKARWTKALKKASTPNDFQKIFLGETTINTRTLFINGVHDDNNWLYYRAMANNCELAYNLSFIINGFKTQLDDNLNIVGLGKSFSPITWKNGIRGSKDLKHYTRNEVEKACSHGPIELLATHEPPYGTKFNNRESTAQGIQRIIFATQPKLVVHRSYDKSLKEYSFLNSKCFAIPAYDIIYFDYSNGEFTKI